MSKQIQLPREYLFSCMTVLRAVKKLIEDSSDYGDLVSQYFDDYTVNSIDYLYRVSIEKLEANIKRKAYSSYISESEPARRETLRKEYLDKAGIQEDWRSQHEISFHNENE